MQGVSFFSIIFIILSVTTWGLWGFFGKVAMEKGMPAFSIFLAETLVGFLIGLAVILAFKLNGTPMPWQMSWNIFGFLSGAGLAIGILFYYIALQGAPASVIVPITATYPVVTVLLAFLFLGESFTVVQWGGFIAVIAGSMMLLSDA